MIPALVLAAGQSRRMGEQKLLLPIAGRPMITAVVDQLLLCPVTPVLVVVGPDSERIRRALAGRRVQFVVNDRPDSEMLHSVRCGLQAVAREACGVLIALGDQPAITREIVVALINAFHTLERGIVVPTYQGRRGHPLLLAARYFPEVLTQHDQVGLRGLLATHTHDVSEIEIDAPAILQDIDTPADYMRAAK
jgi:molybdenum cofactor cytidylyltransferase